VREYELMYIVNPSLGGDDEYAAFVDRINSMIASYGGSPITGEPSPIGGRRKLAYPIRSNGQDLTEGFYVLTRFEAKPEQINLIERDLKLAEPIIRYLLIRPDPAKPAQDAE
jgi:small subunit ribosomal protein S6